METMKETKDVSEGQKKDLQRVSLQLPTQIVKVIEAAVTLGDSESIEAFVADATTERANAFERRVRALFGGPKSESSAPDAGKTDRRRGPRSKHVVDADSAAEAENTLPAHPPALATAAARNGLGD